MAEDLSMANRIAASERPESPPSSARPAPAAPSTGDVRAWIEPIEKFIAEHPGACLASALIAGAALAWWIKRR
jgi:hypothetical protein